MNDFSRHDLDTLKAQVDLAALMRQAGIDLQPAGKNLKACCPWHDDKKPSLVFNPAKQLYNCFSCKAKGDVLDVCFPQMRIDIPACYFAGISTFSQSSFCGGGLASAGVGSRNSSKVAL